MTGLSYRGRDLEAMSFAQRYHKWIADIFAPYLQGLVIEVGAGSGNFSPYLLERGAEHLITVEPSKEMYLQISERFKNDARVDIRNSFFSDVSLGYTGAVDTVVYVNVLEHIQEDLEELRLAYSALRSGGHICVFVPALPFLYSAFDASVGHYRRYRKEQLKVLLEDAGFSVIKISYFDLFGIIPWFIYFKLLRRPFNPGSVSMYDTVVVPIARIIESMIPPPIGKNLFVIAQKK